MRRSFYMCSFVQFFVFCIFFNALIAPILFSEKKLSENALLEMIEGSFKGEWYPLSNKSLPYEGFKLMNGLLYKVETGLPFTGWYSQFDGNKKPRLLCSFMEGKRQGVYVEWDGFGVVRVQGNHFDGMKDGVFSEWNADGNKVSERTYLIGNLHGRSNYWYDDGNQKLEAFFEFGLMIEARGWLSDGKPCPYTKVKDGRGVVFNFGKDFLKNLLEVEQVQGGKIKQIKSAGTTETSNKDLMSELPPL